MPRASSEQMRSYFGFLVGNYAGSVDLFGVNRSVDVKPDYNLSSSRFSRCNYTLFFLMINLIFCVVLNVQYFSKIIVIVFNRTWEFSKQNKSFNKVTRCCPIPNSVECFSGDRIYQRSLHPYTQTFAVIILVRKRLFEVQVHFGIVPTRLIIIYKNKEWRFFC